MVILLSLEMVILPSIMVVILASNMMVISTSIVMLILSCIMMVRWYQTNYRYDMNNSCDISKDYDDGFIKYNDFII